MASPTDIITYVGVPLAVLGVLPIIYTALRTYVARWRVSSVFAKYGVEGKVNSRSVLGTIEIDTPIYEFKPLKRTDSSYWKTRDASEAAASHDLSWQCMSWEKVVVERTLLRLHFADKLSVPLARVEFRALIEYLGDLGCFTNRDAFFRLCKEGRLDPDTCLIQQRDSRGEVVPILVASAPTQSSKGRLVFHFKNAPLNITRSASDLQLSYVPLNIMSYSPKHDLEAQLPSTTLFKIDQTGIIEIRNPDSSSQAIHGVQFWFVYCLFACSARQEGAHLNGAPFGFKMRLVALYTAQECALPISAENYHPEWLDLFTSICSPKKMDTIPEEWTRDSPERTPEQLRVRFQGMTDIVRGKSNRLRKTRQAAIEQVRTRSSRNRHVSVALRIAKPTQDLYMPIQCLDITPEVWSKASKHASQDILEGLHRSQPPTPEELCYVVCINLELREKIATILAELRTWLKDDISSLRMLKNKPAADMKIAYLCAIIVLDAIAANADYLASLIDVEECLGRWPTVLLA